MAQLELQNIVYKDGKYYIAPCLNVDVSSFGDTEQEALDNLQEALELYFEDTPSVNISSIEAPHVKTLTLQSA
jgi:predicted RNase H-like HicB family nuclease